MKLTFCAFDGQNTLNGVNAWLQWFLPTLKEKGYDIEVLFILWAKREKCTTLPILEKQGIKCTEIQYNPYYTEYHAAWIAKYISDTRPDIFIPGNSVAGLFAGKYVKAMGIPVVGILHNNDDENEGVIEEFVFGKEEYRVSAMVGVSKILFQKIVNANLLTAHIPCGVSVPQLPDLLKNLQKPIKIVYLGRIAQTQKRILELVKAFCEITYAFSNIEASIYGAGPEEEAVKQILNVTPKKGNVTFRGLIPNHQVGKVLTQSDIIVLFSDYEGLPVALMEAMVHGVVPICYNSESGINELIIHNETGILIEDRGQSFIEAVDSLVQNPKKRHELAQNAQNLIKNYYSKAITLEKWILLFNQLKSIDQGENEIKKVTLGDKLKLPKKNSKIGKVDPREPSSTHKILTRVQNKLKTISSL